MNLKTDVEEEPYGFIVVLTFSVFLATSTVVYGYMILDRVIKGTSSNIPCYPLGGVTSVSMKRD